MVERPVPRQPQPPREPRPGAPGREGGKARGGAADGGSRRDREADAAEAALKQLRGQLVTVLKRLPDVERRVLELRMGLVDGNPHKPGEVAERMGMTIPEVKKIEARAFERIREVGPIKGLERFLGR
jgi:DNA-directed RNA polymerase sigma subunit (sigma70/sigma32)